MIEHSEDETRKTLIGIRDCEVLLHEIYRKLSSMFPDHGPFWDNISVEENSHAFIVDTFISLYDAGYVSFPHARMHFSQIKTNIVDLVSFLKKINKAIITLSEAMDFALAAENSICEREIYKTSENYPKEFNSLLRTLAIDSGKHFSEIASLHARLHPVSRQPPPIYSIPG